MRAVTYDLRLNGAGLRVLFADCPEHVSYANLAGNLYTANRNEITTSDLVVIRPRVDQGLSLPLAPIPGLQPVVERVERLPVHLLFSADYQHHLSKNVNSAVPEILPDNERAKLLPLLREAELLRLAQHSHAILPVSGGCIFHAPSKKYCNQFLRVGNIQRHRAALDAFFFWMLPWLRECGAILTETWTISSLALNATRLLLRYDPRVPRCKMDMLATYHDDSPEAARETEEVLQRITFGTEGRVLVLISACMSGRAIAQLGATVERLWLDRGKFQFVSLYNLRPSLPNETLCDLSALVDEGAFECFDDIPEAQIGSDVIDIDRTTYFPLEVKERLIPITIAVAEPSRKFFDQYGSGVFSVHRDSYVGEQKWRHHAIYPDVIRLLGHPVFKGKLVQKLAGFDEHLKLIVTPPHQAGKVLGKFAQDALGEVNGAYVPLYHHITLNFAGQMTAEEAEIRHQLAACSQADAILIVDDVSVTGGRLTRYQKSLRDLGYRGRIHYMVGIARPESDQQWQRRHRDLTHRDILPKNTLDSIEHIVLPDWNEEECPWCRELRFYTRLRELGKSLPVELAKRQIMLGPSSMRHGLQSEIFFNPFTSAPMKLTTGSIFLHKNTTEADLFAAIASTVQRMRTIDDSQRKLALEYPFVTLIDPTDYLGNTFSDSIIRAGIIRAAMRSEIERLRGEDEKQRALSIKHIMLDPNADSHNVSFELALAMVMRKLPRPGLSAEELGILKERGCDDSFDVLLESAGRAL